MDKPNAEIRFENVDEGIDSEIKYEADTMVNSTADYKETAEDNEIKVNNGAPISYPLTTLKFDEERILPPLFKGAKAWEDIPGFVVITGRNGSGKSQLLKYMHAKHLQKTLIPLSSNHSGDFSQEEVLYIEASHRFDQMFGYQSQHDLTYEYENPEARRNIITQVLDWCKQDRGPSSRLAMQIKKRIEKELKLGILKSRNLNEDDIEERAARTIGYELNTLRLTDPLSFLNYLVKESEKRKQSIKRAVTQLSEATKLFKYYSYDYQSNTPKLAPLDFLDKLRDRTFLDNLVECYATDKLKRLPLEEVNAILRKYKFKYSIHMDDAGLNNSFNNNGKLVLKRDLTTIMPEDLSSGEIMVLSMITWQYYVQGLSVTGDEKDKQLDSKIKVLLLDEPDKHLDPKLCELFYKIIYHEFFLRGIQVIMTTHRLDTVSLAPEKSIHVIENSTDGAIITKRHKLHVMFRMSANLRDLIDYHHKVYTESVSDALFYEGVYHTLKRLCGKVRDEVIVRGSTDYYWYIDVDPKRFARRLLSNRYQMSFHSVSEKEPNGNKKSKGGCDKVKASIIRDLTSLENLANGEKIDEPTIATHWLRTRRVLSDIRLYRSYGVFDHDYGKDYQFERDNIKEHVVVLPRHSLENYLLDPIIFCSMLTEEEIINCIENSNVVFGPSSKQCFGSITEAVSNSFADKDVVESNFTRVRNKRDQAADLISACSNIKYYLKIKRYDLLQEYLNIYFEILLNTINLCYKYRPDSDRTKEEKPIYANVTAQTI